MVRQPNGAEAIGAGSPVPKHLFDVQVRELASKAGVASSRDKTISILG